MRECSSLHHGDSPHPSPHSLPFQFSFPFLSAEPFALTLSVESAPRGLGRRSPSKSDQIESISSAPLQTQPRRRCGKPPTSPLHSRPDQHSEQSAKPGVALPPSLWHSTTRQPSEHRVSNSSGSEEKEASLALVLVLVLVLVLLWRLSLDESRPQREKREEQVRGWAL